MFKKILIFSFFFLPFFIIVRPAFSANDFETSIKASYKIGGDRDVNVSQEVTIENLRPDLYVSQYSIRINNPEINNISAWDAKGSILVKTKKEANETSLELSFNEQVTGIGNSLFFILKYTLPNFVKKEGLIQRILVPSLSSEALPKQYSVEVLVPNSFGRLSFSSPEADEIEKETKLTRYLFNKPGQAKSGIILDFGDFQVFDFKLNYQIDNFENFSITKEISLPPDTEYQTIRYSKIDPPPENVQKDDDGNWLASYKLKPKEKVAIMAEGKVKLFSSPLNQISLNKQSLERYLKEETFWEVNHPKIKELSQKLKTPKEIYDFVVKKLEYNYDRVNSTSHRLGALASLDNPKNCLCTEFTDLFVALARSSGIPSREIEGYAYTNNPKQTTYNLTRDILHSWPQFYDFDKNVWRMADPTWEKTSSIYGYFENFDMSHFTFVIHGLDSQLPPPAGTFKDIDRTEKNISILFGDNLGFNEPSKIEVKIALNPSTIFDRYVKGNIIIKNSGPAAVYDNSLRIYPQNLLNPILDVSSFSVLLPFSSILIPIKMNNPNYFLKRIKYENLSIKLNQDIFEEKIDLKTYTPLYFYLPLVSILTVFFLLVYKFLLKVRRKL